MGVFLTWSDLHGAIVRGLLLQNGDMYWSESQATWREWSEDDNNWRRVTAAHLSELLERVYFWPLEKFMGATKILTPDEALCLPPKNWLWQRGRWVDVASVDDQPYLPPEPSPADRALDEFIARRKAKRGLCKCDRPECARNGCRHVPYARPDVSPAEMARRAAATRLRFDIEDTLDRAMSQLGPHDTELHERIMPYRLESKS